MKKLATFHWAYESRFNENGSIVIYIDPSQVTFVRKSVASEGGTYISFSNGASICVTEDINYVYQTIWGIS